MVQSNKNLVARAFAHGEEKPILKANQEKNNEDNGLAQARMKFNNNLSN